MKNIKLSENTGIQLPAKNLLMIVAGAVVATISFFELENRIGSLETSRELFEADLLKKSQQLPTDQEQFMLLEHIASQVENIQKEMETMRNNNVNINYAMKDIEKIKENSLTRSGLSKVDSLELKNLFKEQKQAKADKVSFSPRKARRIRELLKQKNEKGLSKLQAAALNGYYADLAALSSKEATDYYVDILNNWLSKLDTSSLEEEFGIKNIDKLSAEILLSPERLEPLFKQSPEFKKWFLDNHITKEVPVQDMDGAWYTELKYERLYVWSVVKPTDSNMIESYKIKDPTGKVIDTIAGVPNLDYSARVVKEKYRTRTIIGVTKDNQGQFLPKSREEMAKNTELSDEDKFQFINDDYYKLQKEDPAKFALLEKLKEHHLKNQEGLSYRSKLYLDFPRFRKGNLEVIQSTSLTGKTKEKYNALTLFAQRAKDWIRGDGDRAEDGLNHEDRLNIVRADIFDNEITDIPIAGLYDINVRDVSTNITLSMMRYMSSAERQKQLIEASPVVRAIQKTVNNASDPNRPVKDAKGKEYRNRGLLRYKERFENIRAKAVNNIIEREFEGITQADRFGNTPWLNNLTNLLFKRASFSFFALNIPSALKNSLGMKFQSMIEASGGKYVNHISLQKGNAWAYKAMGELSFTGALYKKGTKSHNLQLIDVFDPIQGRFEEKFATEFSRTGLEDAASFSWLYSPRKWVEIQAGIQLFGGMMYKKKVKQTLPDGTTKEIPYIDAFETIDGQIKLKEGIDIRYNIKPTVHEVSLTDTVESLAKKYNVSIDVIEKALKGDSLKNILREANSIELRRDAALADVQNDLLKADSELEKTKLIDKQNAINDKFNKQRANKGSITINNSEFKFMKNRIHQVQNNMGGAYAKFDQPEAQRYLAFRFISYLRRYFTTMATNRWGWSGPIWDPKPRLNPGLGDHHMGFYIEFGQTIANTIRAIGSGEMPFYTAEEKTAALKMLTEVGMLFIISMLQGLLFGWDDKDPERNKKLRELSGAMPFLGLTSDDKERPFNLFGFMEVHALHLLMQVEAENEQFNLITGGLKQYNELLDIKSVALGPTTDAYMVIWDDTKKILTGDPKANYSRKVGPYDWQSKGGSKFITHFAKTFGLTGSSLDPALAIQNFQSYQAKVRR